MQTFVPFENYEDSAECLDRQRLGKQRVEVLQIYNALTGHSHGWANHPATRMWRGHAGALLDYGIMVCLVWTARGYIDNTRDKLLTLRDNVDLGESFHYPPWWGGPIHESHQAALVRKDPNFYRPIFPDVDDTIPYYWPV
jgi:hypothetical protein